MSEIIVTENFIEEEQFQKIQSTLMGSEFEWRFNDHVNRSYDLNETEDVNIFQFVHVFYSNHSRHSNYFNLIDPYIKKLNVKSLIRVKANLLTRTNEIIEHGYHTDQNFDCKTAIAYINTNNGYTIFDDGKKINSVENRVVQFDTNIEHSGSTCTDQKTRIVINFNYF